MTWPACKSEARRFGKNRNGTQRYQCLTCRRTFTPKGDQSLGNMRLEAQRAVLALRLLLEGNSIRATERLTGVNRNTIIDLVVMVGERCDKFMRTAITGVECDSVQCDEIWSYVLRKAKHRQKKGYGELYGDCYTWTALEPETKLPLAYAVGKRDNATAMTFVRRLRNATGGNFHIDTDGLSIYRSVIPLAFGWHQDHAQIVKIYGKAVEGEGRYSPARLIGLHVEVGGGQPDLDQASTSLVERSNKTLRMQIRRFTRLTDGHSKKWQNHEAAIALFFCFYDFCRIHSTVKTSPAVAAGLTDHVWTVGELLARIAESTHS